MKKEIITGLLCLSAANLCQAGLYATTAHSRANCGNNESVTWWAFHYYNWRVVSIHNYNNHPAHYIDTGYAITWRQAAVHWGEAPPTQKQWAVTGHHFLSDYAGGQVPFQSEYVIDCSIYDGWWN